jgi:hypothetical protein
MDFKQFGTGRCINCGFLGKRDKQNTFSMCYEASDIERQTGWLNLQVGSIATRPWCFVGKVNFVEELQTMGVQEIQADKMGELLSKDRKCPSWYPWTPFRNPKEHFEELKVQQLEQARRIFELKLEKQNREERKRTNRIMICLAVAAIIFAALQVYAALATINPNSWLFNWLR